MMQTTIAMAGRKNIALVAHDNKKEELFEWAKLNCKLLAEHSLYASRHDRSAPRQAWTECDAPRKWAFGR